MILYPCSHSGPIVSCLVLEIVGSVSPLPVQGELVDGFVDGFAFLVPSYRSPPYCTLPHKVPKPESHRLTLPSGGSKGAI